MRDSMKNKLAIFDLDGTLIDTGRANYEAYSEALRSVGKGWSLSYEDFMRDCFGRNYWEFLNQFSSAGNEEIEEVHKKKTTIYPNYLRLCGRRNKGLFDIMDGISDDYYLALVTTASRENATAVLQIFGCEDCFDLMITAEDVKRIKPDPEAYIKAAQHFQVDVADTILFEDFAECANAAARIGLSVYQIKNF